MNLAQRIQLSCTKYAKQQLIYDDQIVTYEELWDTAAQVRQAFWDLGVRPGDRVVLQLPKCLEFLYAHLANLQLGSISIPLNPTYTPEEIAYFLADSGAKVFITDHQQASFVQPKSAAFPDLEYVITVGSSTGSVSSGADVLPFSSLLPPQNQNQIQNQGQDQNSNQNQIQSPDQDQSQNQIQDQGQSQGHSKIQNQSQNPKGPSAAEVGSRAKPTDTALIIYTSGTTGRSKGAMLSHENLLTTIESLHTIWGHSDQDVLLHVLPIFHVHGLLFAFHGALHAGMKIIMRSKFGPSDTLSCIEQYGCTVFMGVPTMYHRLLQAAESGQAQLRTMRLWVSGSAPLAAVTFEQFKQKFGHTVLERYGMSETGINTSNPLNGERKPGSVGMPLPGVSLHLVSLDDAEVQSEETEEHVGLKEVEETIEIREIQPGEVGEVWVKGKNVFQGYWQMPEKTQESFKDGWFLTGDLGYLDADGYLFLIGRSKDLIISGGMNVYPKEIEAVIELSSAVEEAAVVGVPDADLGERVVAYVVAKAGQEVNLAEIAALCQAKLAGYKRPKAIYAIDQLPRNTMGKVTKNQLRNRGL